VAPLPSLDHFSPYSTQLDATSILRSPTREPLVVGNTGPEGECQAEDSLEYLENSDSFEPLNLDQALVGDVQSLGEFN